MNKKIFGAMIFVIAIAIALVVALHANVFASSPQYVGQTRSMTITAVPLGVHEMQDTLGYLKVDFATGGVLDGKEVYGFSPNSLTVYKGDTLDVTLVNPADDDHTFTITGMDVDTLMKGKTVTKVSFTAKQAGIFKFYCNEPEHAPYMWGQLVVLPDSAAGE